MGATATVFIPGYIEYKMVGKEDGRMSRNILYYTTEPADPYRIP